MRLPKKKKKRNKEESKSWIGFLKLHGFRGFVG